MNKVVFFPLNIEAESVFNENVFRLAQRVGVLIPTACNGSGTCGLCRIEIISGEECLNGQTKVEVNHLGNLYHITKKRLSCQCKFIIDGTVIVKIE